MTGCRLNHRSLITQSLTDERHDLGTILTLDAAIDLRQTQTAQVAPWCRRMVISTCCTLATRAICRRQAALGDALIVGLNSDASTGRAQAGRPIVPQEERAELLAARSAFNVVVIFDDVTATRAGRRPLPRHLRQGRRYGAGRRTAPPEAEIVAGYGGRVDLLPFIPERSTTRSI